MRQLSHKMENSNTKWVLGHKITPHDISGNYDLVMGETPPNTMGPPPHTHHGYHESFLIIEGEMEFMLNGETQTLKPGEAIDIPANALHTFSNNNGSICKWVNIHSPKGFLKFFHTLGVSTEEHDAFQKSLTKEKIQEVIQTAHTYDMHIKQ